MASDPTTTSTSGEAAEQQVRAISRSMTPRIRFDNFRGLSFILAVKAAVDLDNTTGQFYLAGSTRFLFEPHLSESLADLPLFVDL
jgi:hypothetical protein